MKGGFMITKSSNLVICQLDLLNEIEKIKNLIKVSEQDLLSDVYYQAMPLLFQIHIDSFVNRLEKLKSKVENIENRVKEIK